jgi:hypothetical protein
MIKFNKPTNLNGAELRDELRAVGVSISDDPFAVVIENNDLLLDIDEKNQFKANEIVASHNGNVAVIEATIEEKLASVGLSINDLKAALGI